MHAAHPEVEIYWYDAGHAFNNDTRASYNAEGSEGSHGQDVSRFSTGIFDPPSPYKWRP